MRAAILCGLLALAMLGIGAATQARDKPASDADYGFFGQSRAELLANVHRLGVLNVGMPREFYDRTDAKAAISAAVCDYLRKAGFELEDSSYYDQMHVKFSKAVGGLYDPVTGELRQQQAEAVYQNARRAYAEAKRLDAIVNIDVEWEQAKVTYDLAYWDGVVERADGKARQSVMKALFPPGKLVGRLPALSLLVRISNPENKVLFGRMAAIQLSGYFSTGWTTRGADFHKVPMESLLRDLPRIDRAAHMIALPLLYPVDQFEALRKSGDKAKYPYLIKPEDLPAPPDAQVAAPPEPALKVERELLHDHVHRVVVTRLEDMGSINVTPAVAERYLELVRNEIKGLGWELLPVDRVHTMIASEVARRGNAYDPNSGEFNASVQDAARRAVLAQLNIDPQPDTVLWLQLGARHALHRFGNVEWDGVGQNAVDLGPIRSTMLFSSNSTSEEGDILVLSLQVQLRDLDNRLLYEKRGGIQVLQQLRRDELTNLTNAELFSNPDRDAGAVHAALDELVQNMTTPTASPPKQPPPAGTPPN